MPLKNKYQGWERCRASELSLRKSGPLSNALYPFLSKVDILDPNCRPRVSWKFQPEISYLSYCESRRKQRSSRTSRSSVLPSELPLQQLWRTWRAQAALPACTSLQSALSQEAALARPWWPRAKTQVRELILKGMIRRAGKQNGTAT